MRSDRPLSPWLGALALGILAAPACGATTGVQDDLPVGLFAYDRGLPLDVQETPDSERETVRVSRMSFASPGGGRVTGLLAVPTSGGPHAGVVVMHGLPGTAENAMTNQGLEIAARGAVVIAIDAPWARRGGLPDFTIRDSVEQVQLIQDLRRAVDVLVARPDVDAGRLAYVGGSYGGAMGALFAGIERRVRAVVLIVPDGGLVAHFTDAAGSPTGPLARATAEARARWLSAMRPIEPIRFIARAAPTPLLFQNGRRDQAVTVDDAEALHAAAREPKTVQWYDAGHGLTPEARSDRVSWLVERLGMGR
jgi:dienelactone hydrolase